MMSYLLYIFMLLPIASLDGSEFRCDYRYFSEANGHLKYHAMPAVWDDARLRCHLEGATLASPLNTGLANSINKLLKTSCSADGKSIFIGVHATFSQGDYFSIEGVPLSEIPNIIWSRNEPNNHNNEESCMILHSDSKWADVKCSETFPYVCYKQGSKSMSRNNCGTIDSEYTLDTRTGSCYKFHKVPRTWYRANMACRAEGGYLVIINNDIEATVIKEIFRNNPGDSMLGNFWKDVAFIGFNYWNGSGEFMTIHGDTLKQAGYDKFSGGEPNNSTTGEFCGSVYRSGLLNDIWCENQYAFICEMDPNKSNCIENKKKYTGEF